MNKFKENRQSDYVVEKKLTRYGARVKNIGKKYGRRYPQCSASVKQKQKKNYILRKVTQRSKNLKWFFWRLEQRGWNRGILICRQLPLKQAHNAEVILQ